MVELTNPGWMRKANGHTAPGNAKGAGIQTPKKKTLDRPLWNDLLDHDQGKKQHTSTLPSQNTTIICLTVVNISLNLGLVASLFTSCLSELKSANRLSERQRGAVKAAEIEQWVDISELRCTVPEIFAEATSIFQKVRFEPNEIEYKQPLSSVKPPWKIQVYKCMIVSLGQCHLLRDWIHPLKGSCFTYCFTYLPNTYTYTVYTHIYMYLYMYLYKYISSQVPWTSQVSSSLMTNVSEDV